MAKRKDTSSGLIVTKAQLAVEVKQGVAKDGTEYKSVQFFLVMPGCPIPLRLAPKSMKGEDGGMVVWLDLAGRSLKDVALSGHLPH